MAAQGQQKTEQVLVRLPHTTYSALQLALPFAGRRSMQDLLAAVIDEYLATLRSNDDGYAHALIGLRESEARREGVLSRRRTTSRSSAS